MSFVVCLIFRALQNWLPTTAGIADGGEFYIRLPGTAAWLLIELNVDN
jgi:hypothetical protein